MKAKNYLKPIAEPSIKKVLKAIPETGIDETVLAINLKTSIWYLRKILTNCELVSLDEYSKLVELNGRPSLVFNRIWKKSINN